VSSDIEMRRLMQTEDLVVLDLGTSEPSQSDFEFLPCCKDEFLPCCKDGSCSFLDVPETTAVLQDTGQPTPTPQFDGHGGLNLVVPEKPPVPVSSSDDDDSMLSAFKGCGELSTSDETVNALLSSFDADSVLSGPVTAVFQDTGQPTRTDASYMVSCSPSTSVHSSDTVQSPVSPGFVTGTSLQQLTNATIHLAVSGCNGLFVHYTQKQVQLKVSVFLLYPLGSVCLKYSMKPHLLTC